jgi:hypothetical protein
VYNANEKLTKEELMSNLHYDQLTGIFTRKLNAIKGTPAGYINTSGYLRIMVSGNIYQAHRLAWLYITGRFPKSQIDHINRNRSDNRFCNLREANHYENQWNVSIQKRNTSGHKGVSWDRRRSKWVAMCCINRKQKNIGRFDDINKAIDARISFAKNNQMEFFRDV